MCYSHRNDKRTDAVYLLQSAGWFHDVSADRKTRPISSTTRKKLCQGQTEVVQENLVDLQPATEGSLSAQTSVQHL